jgi:hypothetical protein
MDPWIQIAFWIPLVLLLVCLIFEILPINIKEGFEGLVPVGDSQFWAKLVPRRGDVVPDQ